MSVERGVGPIEGEVRPIEGEVGEPRLQWGIFQKVFFFHEVFMDASLRSLFDEVMAFCTTERMKKRTCNQCGACCIAPSISSPLPGMPYGKPAGVRCVNLTEDNRCSIFGQASRPAVCREWQPTPQLCGGSFDEAMAAIGRLEEMTSQ